MDAAARAVLARIHDEQRARGEEVAPPVTDDELAELAGFVRRHVGVAPPAGYLGFLRVANGLDVDGTTVYAARQRRRPNGTVQLGLPEENSAFADGVGPASWLLIGERGDDLFAVDVRDGRGHVVDRVSLDVIDTFPGTEDLLRHVLTSIARP